MLRKILSKLITSSINNFINFKLLRRPFPKKKVIKGTGIQLGKSGIFWRKHEANLLATTYEG